MSYRAGLVFGCIASVLALVMCGGDDTEAGPGTTPSEAGTGTDPREGGGSNVDPTVDGGDSSTPGQPGPRLSFFKMLPGAFNSGFGDAQPIAAVPTGGFVVALPFTGSVTIGSDALTSNGRSVALVKVDGKGDPVWAKAIQPNDETRILSVAADSTGTIYLVGRTFALSVDFGNSKTLSSPTGDSKKSWGFVAKLDANGVAQWAQKLTADGGFLHLQVAAQPQAVVVTGTASLGSIRYPTSSGSTLAPAFMGYESKVFIVSLSPADGTATWFEQMSAPSGAEVAALQLLPSNDIVLSGMFRDGALQSDDPATFAESKGQTSAFVTRFSATGTQTWTRSYGGGTTSTTSGSALAVDASGHLVVAGAFSASVDFGAGLRTGSAWVLSLDPATGNTTWDKALPTGVPVGLALDAKGGVLVSLDMYKATAPAASVDGVAFPTTQQGFKAGLDAAGKVLWLHTVAGKAPTFSGALAGGSALVEYNSFQGTADFGNGSVTSRDGGVTAYLLGLESVSR